MKIEVLGPGCARCDQLYQNTIDAVSALGPAAVIDVKKVKDIQYFIKVGVFVTPGLLIDGEVISVGKVLPVDEIRRKIEEKL